MKRILAWIGILAIIIGFVALIYFTATGAPSNTIIAILFCMLVIPIIIHGFLISMKFFSKHDDSSDSQK